MTGMSPREIAEFFDCFERATDAFWEAVEESANKALDEVTSQLTMFWEETSELVSSALGLEPEVEDLHQSAHETVWAEDLFSLDGDRPLAQFHFHVGDATCRFNALSSDLRCAVNPYGPCRCQHFEPRKETDDSLAYPGWS